MTRATSRADAVSAGETGGLLTIDLNAIAANWRLLNARMGGPAAHKCCAAVVKADGYGLGAVPVVRRLLAEGCKTFFVAHVEEGIALRTALADSGAEIFVLNGLLPGGEALLARYRLAPCLNDVAQVRAWLDFCVRTEPQMAALHVDTGMTRLGLDPDELDDLDHAAIGALPGLILMSHLACADEPVHPLNHQQLAAFRRIRGLFPTARASLANSSGMFLGDEYLFDLGRPGVALYGGNPTPYADINPMRAVVHLQARILQLRQIRDIRPVGYGATADTYPPARIATLAVGYADGYLRAISNRGVVYLNGHPCPVVGRVSMDLLTVDVTDAAGRDETIAAGALVDLLSETHTVDDVAATADTIGYEILTSLGERYHRRYIDTAHETPLETTAAAGSAGA